jgi:hypothetical protein
MRSLETAAQQATRGVEDKAGYYEQMTPTVQAAVRLAECCPQARETAVPFQAWLQAVSSSGLSWA